MQDSGIQLLLVVIGFCLSDFVFPCLQFSKQGINCSALFVGIGQGKAAQGSKLCSVLALKEYEQTQ